MTTRNGLLETASLSIISFLVLSINWIVLDRGTEMISGETALGAITLAQEVFEEIHYKAFDRAGIDSDGNSFYVENAGDLTPSSQFGEYANANNLTRVQFRTVDDYHGYTEENIDLGRINDYRVWIEVDYIRVDDLTAVSNTQTHIKRVTVNVSSNSLGITDPGTGTAVPIQFQMLVSNNLTRN